MIPHLLKSTLDAQFLCLSLQGFHACRYTEIIPYAAVSLLGLKYLIMCPCMVWEIKTDLQQQNPPKSLNCIPAAVTLSLFAGG
mmetsp:Transcript_9252/g.14948  ORF Transcript_9252/g.14948 Transcript_9252/m.14948 type:complete len:83 (+) Transcript_9252:226-474(+)